MVNIYIWRKERTVLRNAEREMWKKERTHSHNGGQIWIKESGDMEKVKLTFEGGVRWERL